MVNRLQILTFDMLQVIVCSKLNKTKIMIIIIQGSKMYKIKSNIKKQRVFIDN